MSDGTRSDARRERLEELRDEYQEDVGYDGAPHVFRRLAREHEALIEYAAGLEERLAEEALCEGERGDTVNLTQRKARAMVENELRGLGMTMAANVVRGLTQGEKHAEALAKADDQEREQDE